MYYSNYLEHESQTSKWDRVRVDYNLVKRILQAKEHQTEQPKTNKVKIQSTVK